MNSDAPGGQTARFDSVLTKALLFIVMLLTTALLLVGCTSNKNSGEREWVHIPPSSSLPVCDAAWSDALGWALTLNDVPQEAVFAALGSTETTEPLLPEPLQKALDAWLMDCGRDPIRTMRVKCEALGPGRDKDFDAFFPEDANFFQEWHSFYCGGPASSTQ